MNSDVLCLLRQQDLAATLNDSEIEVLAEITAPQSCLDGEVLLQEGHSADALYIVARGSVEMSMSTEESSDTPSGEFSITRLGAGALIGEMCFMGGEPSSATVRAAGPCDLLVVKRDQLARAVARAPSLEPKLHATITRALVRRMRTLGARHLEVVRSERQQIQLRNQFSNFFTVTLILFGIASLVQKLINTGLPPLMQMLYSWGLLLLTFTPIAGFTLHLKLPRSVWGLTLNNAERSVKESLIVGAGMAVAMVALRWVLKPAAEPLVNWGSLSSYSRAEFCIFFLVYGPHCFVQELIGRGVIQGALTRFMQGTRPMSPVLLTSALFGIFHLYVSVTFAALTFAVSVLFGWLYRRHGTLVGVTTLHYLLGMVSVAMGFN